MAYQVIGHCACPLCSFSQQEIRLSDKNNKPYIVCDECGMQLFTRQARSVKLLNERAAASQPAPAETPAKPKPAAPAPEPAKPKPAAPAKPDAPAHVPHKLDEEKTIFDIWKFK